MKNLFSTRYLNLFVNIGHRYTYNVYIKIYIYAYVNINICIHIYECIHASYRYDIYIFIYLFTQKVIGELTTICFHPSAFHRTNHRWSGIPWYKILSPGHCHRVHPLIHQMDEIHQGCSKKKYGESIWLNTTALDQKTWYDDQSPPSVWGEGMCNVVKSYHGLNATKSSQIIRKTIFRNNWL